MTSYHIHWFIFVLQPTQFYWKRVYFVWHSMTSVYPHFGLMSFAGNPPKRPPCVLHTSVCDFLWISGPWEDEASAQSLWWLSAWDSLLVGTCLWKGRGHFWAACVPARATLGVESQRGQRVGGRLSYSYFTYPAGQILLVPGVCQGHGVGRQDVAGGFHLFPDFLVQVL